MKKLLAVAVFLLGMSAVVHAQSEIPAPLANDNAAVDFARTSASNQPTASPPDLAATSYAAASTASNFSNSFGSTALSAPAALETFAPQPTAEPSSAAPPAPFPSYDPTERYQRWQVGLGFAFVRFRSSVYSASAVGLNSSLAYSLKDWLAIEGAVTSAFAPAVYQNELVKYVGYAGGPKIIFGNNQLQPWVHFLIGGTHLLPQTAFGGQNGFEVLAGGGVDYNFSARWAARLEADWVNTHVFGQSQNNGQAALGVVLHF